MSLEHDIATAERYIARAEDQIEKQRLVLSRTKRGDLNARARNMLEFLIAMRADAEKERSSLQERRITPKPPSAKASS